MLDQLRMAVPATPEPQRRGGPRGAGGPGRGPGGRGPRAAGAGVLSLAVWAGMTGPQHWTDPATWAIGGAAALAVAGLVWRAPRRQTPPAGPRRRLSAWGALRLSVWFAGQAVRGAVDVARRAFDPALPVAPGWYRHPLRLPPGAPWLVMANAVTMLPGTLTAELRADGAGEGGHLIIHLIDVQGDPGPELAALEARVRGLFALPAPAGPAPVGEVLPDPPPGGPPPSGPAPIPAGSGLPVVVPAPSVRPSPSGPPSTRPKDTP